MLSERLHYDIIRFLDSLQARMRESDAKIAARSISEALRSIDFEFNSLSVSVLPCSTCFQKKTDDNIRLS